QESRIDRSDNPNRSVQEPSIKRAKGSRDGRSEQTRKRPRSYAGRETMRRLDDDHSSGAEPGELGDEERKQMARATTAPVPVMKIADKGPGLAAKGSKQAAGKSSGGKIAATAGAATAGAATAGAATGAPKAAKAKRQLGGPGGASFEGVTQDGALVPGLHW